MRKDDKYRFSLQWGSDTQEKIAAGDFLEKLGNKKSDFIVLAIWEYLQRHPEAVMPGAKIKITTQATLTREQILSDIKNAVRIYMEEHSIVSSTEMPNDKVPANCNDSATAPSETDLLEMLDNLNAFDM